ncbi:hypothetical protein [Pseudomonas putida]
MRISTHFSSTQLNLGKPGDLGFPLKTRLAHWTLHSTEFQGLTLVYSICASLARFSDSGRFVDGASCQATIFRKHTPFSDLSSVLSSATHSFTQAQAELEPDIDDARSKSVFTAIPKTTTEITYWL